jgi:hypothetical protein
MAAANTLGVGLAGVPVAVVMGAMGETVRGAGFGPEVALGNAVHPVALLQALLPGLFGSLSAPVESWWGGAFFTKGFPYFLSLYVGPLALALAAAGVGALDRRTRWVLLVAAGLGLWYALGACGGLAPLVSSWRVARWFRFPVKAMLLPHVAVCVLAGLGLDRLREGAAWGGSLAAGASLALASRRWRRLTPGPRSAGPPSIRPPACGTTAIVSDCLRAGAGPLGVTTAAGLARGTRPARWHDRGRRGGGRRGPPRWG